MSVPYDEVHPRPADSMNNRNLDETGRTGGLPGEGKSLHAGSGHLLGW
jgi:hypothetical protein